MFTLLWLRKRKAVPFDSSLVQPSPTSTSRQGRAPRKISQRTVAMMIQIYERLFRHPGQYSFHDPLLDIDKFRNTLFAMGMPQQFLDKCEFTYHWHFASLLPALHNGTFFSENARLVSPEAQVYGQNGLLAFATGLCGIFAQCPEYEEQDTRFFRSSLLHDGFQFVGGRLLETSQDIVDEADEISAVEALIRSAIHDNSTVLLHHFVNGSKLFRDGSYHPCVNEWRSFLEETLRGVWRLTRANRRDFITYSARPNMSDVFDFLQRAGFFNADEKLAFSSTWGFLSAGGHPGISERDDAHLAMILSLTFAHAALLKLHTWRDNSYTHF